MNLVLAPITLTMLVFGPAAGAAFEYSNDLARWVVTKAPVAFDEKWHAAQSDAEHSWIVYLRDARPSARLAGLRDPVPPPLPFEIPKGSAGEGLSGRRFDVRVEGGWIVAFNAGEWGAGLWWFSPDGGERYRIAADCWVNAFVETDAGLLALEGITHGNARGRIIRLTRGGGGRWDMETLIPLGEEPYAAAKDGDRSLVVVTNHRLLRIRAATKEVDVLIDDGFWGALYPSSLVVSGGTVFIGMRHGVARIEQRGRRHRVDWLLPIPEFDRVTNRRAGFR